MSEDKEKKTDLNTSLFVNLVVMLGSSAMQQMGKVLGYQDSKDAKSADKTELDRDLEAAQMSIDMLDMLQAKTKGNLSADEDRILRETLVSLKLSFVEASKRAESASRQAPSAAGSDVAKPESQRAEPAAPGAGATSAAQAEDRRKFHKSYGQGEAKP